MFENCTTGTTASTGKTVLEPHRLKNRVQGGWAASSKNARPVNAKQHKSGGATSQANAGPVSSVQTGASGGSSFGLPGNGNRPTYTFTEQEVSVLKMEKGTYELIF